MRQLNPSILLFPLCLGAAGQLRQRDPLRPHHQAGQLLAEAAYQHRQSEVQV